MSVRVALNMAFSSEAVAACLFAPEVLAVWLGAHAGLRPELGARVLLPPGMAGHVSALAWPASGPGDGEPAAGRRFELTVTLDAAPGQVAFRLSPCADGGCRLRIAHVGLADAAERHDAVKRWQAVLDQVGRLMAQVRHAQRRERQAIVVVHGIGEQRPGQLLREFVANVFDRDAGEVRFVKPDRLSPLFEMRMVTVPRSDASRPTTDVYELYWAHLIRDTTLGQVYGWMVRLLLSKDTTIPTALLRLVWVLRIGLVVALAAAAWLAGTDVSAWLKGLGLGALALLPVLVKPLLSLLGDEFIVGYAGDAARYLEPRAGNMARRQEIREAGANLLDALHDQRRYARIIVYGHSLGSVIAYDILAHAWTRRARERDAVQRCDSRALRRLEDLLNQRSGHAGSTPIDVVQQMQHEAWQEYRRNGFQWRVSDLVTAGSPLAHAAWLLNLDADTRFEDLKRERSMPTCPPQTEDRKSPRPGAVRRVFTFTHAIKDPQRPNASRSVQVPHHAGLFALTRWTNLFFPHHGLFQGDPIAGPLQDVFGDWIKDVPLDKTGGFAHGRYTDRTREPQAVEAVRQALNLPLHRPLRDHADEALAAAPAKHG